MESMLGQRDWKKQYKIILCAASLCLVVAVPGQAYFVDFVNGVRPQGMGEAFVAVADDSNSMLFNAAGLAGLDAMVFSGMYADLYSGLSMRMHDTAISTPLGYNYLAYAMPLGFLAGSAGIYWNQFNAAMYQENVAALSYAKRLWNPYTLDMGLSVDAGLSVKLLQWKTEQNEYTQKYPAYEKSGATLDAGLLVRVGNGLSIGISVDNIIPSDVGLFEPEYVPAVYRMGVAYGVKYRHSMLNSMLGSVECTARNRNYDFKFGIESWWMDETIAVRTGVNRESVSLGFSYIPWKSQLMDIQVDYAFSYPFFIEQSWGSHRMGMTFSWGRIEQRDEANVIKAVDTVNVSNTIVDHVSKINEAIKEIGKDLNVVDFNAPVKKREKIKTIREQLNQLDIKYESIALRKNILEERIQKVKGARHYVEKNVPPLKEIKTRINEKQHDYEDLLLSGKQEVKIKAAATPEPIQTLPEADPDKIIIGVDEQMFEDFGETEIIRDHGRYLQKYLGIESNLVIQWELENASELLLRIQEGKLDILLSYAIDLDAYAREGLIEPILLLESINQTWETCYFLVLESSPWQTFADLHKMRLSCPSLKMFGELKASLKKEKIDVENHFNQITIDKNMQNCFRALQIGTTDAVVVFGYYQYALDSNPNMPKTREIKKVALQSETPIYIKQTKNKEKEIELYNIVRKFKTLHQDARARAILRKFGIKRFKLYR